MQFYAGIFYDEIKAIPRYVKGGIRLWGSLLAFSPYIPVVLFLTSVEVGCDWSI